MWSYCCESYCTAGSNNTTDIIPSSAVPLSSADISPSSICGEQNKAKDWNKYWTYICDLARDMISSTTIWCIYAHSGLKINEGRWRSVFLSLLCLLCQPCRGSLWSLRCGPPQTHGAASVSPSPCQLRLSKSCATSAAAATNPTWAAAAASNRYKWTALCVFNKRKINKSHMFSVWTGLSYIL